MLLSVWTQHGFPLKDFIDKSEGFFAIYWHKLLYYCSNGTTALQLALLAAGVSGVDAQHLLTLPLLHQFVMLEQLGFC